MKLKKTSIALLLGMAGILLAACTTSLSGGFPSGTATQNVLYASTGPAIVALNPDGTQLWRYPEKNDNNKTFFAAPLVANGQVIDGDYQNTLFSLDASNGTEKWTYADAKGRYVASPVLAGSNTIIAANGDGSIYAVDLSGKLLWKFTAQAGFWGTPVVDAQGNTVYAASLDHSLYAIQVSDGKQVWSTDMGGPMLASPLLMDGTLYIGTLGSEMIAVSASDGKIQWKATTTGAIWSTPYLKDGVLYFGDTGNKIYALNASDGTVKFSDDAPGPIVASPGAMPTGLAFVCETGDILVIGYQNERAWTDKVSNGKLYSTPIVFGDRLVVPVQQGDPVLVTYDFSGRKGWTLAAPK